MPPTQNASAPSTGRTPQPGHQGDPRPVLEAPDISRALTRIAHEILERNKGPQGVVLLGIPSRGVPLAARLAANIAAVEGTEVPFGALDVTMYRDDLRLRPARALEHTDLPPGGIDGRTVVLVDDVLFSGRTIRAALDALNDHGRPRLVQLAVLVDRGQLLGGVEQQQRVIAVEVGAGEQVADHGRAPSVASTLPMLTRS